MVLAEREWLRAMGLTGTAVLLFTLYCQLHVWIGSSTVEVTASIRWGLIAGVPSGLAAWSLWCCRARLFAIVARGLRGTGALAAGLFMLVLMGGALLHQLAIGGPLVADLPRRIFELLPVSLLAAVLGVVALRFWETQEKGRKSLSDHSIEGDAVPPAVPAWIVFPEEPRLLLRTADLRMVRSAANYCELHTGDRVHLIRLPIKVAEVRLKDAGFIRVHRTALVNTAHIRSVGPFGPRGQIAVQLQCGQAVAVGRAYRGGVCNRSPD